MSLCKTSVFCVLFLITLSAWCQPASRSQSEAGIRAVLSQQVAAWNKGDIESFMEGYWKSDSILFIGSQATSGWDNTLARYKRSYPDRAAMGTLGFDLTRIDFISRDAYLITGRYTLKREKDMPTGLFTLLFRFKNGKWVIVYDHTS